MYKYKKILHYDIGDNLKKIIIIIICIFVGVLVNKKTDEIIIPSDAIRIRIIANSNNIEDLYEKEKLKNSIKEELYNYVKDANNSIVASKKIKDNLDNIRNLISKKTNNFKVSYGINYFPKKVYKNVIYNEGEYESLVITLGSGIGDNWWCVLYPPICMIDDNENTSDVEYRFLVSDLLSN